MDTAAEVSIISDRISGQLTPPPTKLREVGVHAADRNMKMKGMVVGPVCIKLGSREFSEDVYVAPIKDNMLLGVDFLHKYGVNVHLRQSRLQLGKEYIPMKFGEGPVQGRIARKYLTKRTVIPPNHVKRISGVLDQPLRDFAFEPILSLPVMAPCAVLEVGLGWIFM